MERCYSCMKPSSERVCSHCGFDIDSYANHHNQLKLGTVLNKRYVLGKVLGHGGFGITYIAFDTKFEQPMAIKEYLPKALAGRSETGEIQTTTPKSEEKFHHFMNRFLDEARVLAKFNNEPGIVSVQDFFKENRTVYIVMHYIDGTPLDKYLLDKGGKLLYDEAVKIMLPVLRALDKVHKAGLAHRDISPDNIFITHEKEVKLIDFGAAREILDDDKTMSVILKKGYAPIEQYSSKGNQGPWTDIYASAATLYKLITGQKIAEPYDRLVEETLIPPSELGVDIPETAENALLKALCVHVKDRYKSVNEFIEGLVFGHEEIETTVLLDSSESKKKKYWLPIALVLICIIGYMVWPRNIPNEVTAPEPSGEVSYIEEDESFSISDFSGKKADYARSVLDNQEIAYVLNDVYSDKYIEGYVIMNSHIGETDKNVTVTLTVSKGVAPEAGSGSEIEVTNSEDVASEETEVTNTEEVTSEATVDSTEPVNNTETVSEDKSVALVEFEDAKFKSALEKTLGMTDITEEQAKNIKEIQIPSQHQLDFIGGVEAFDNLEKLVIVNNNLMSLGPILNHTSFKVMVLDNNPIEELNSFVNQKKLEELSVSSCSISSLNGIQNLNIKVLDISDNNISDLSQLSSLNSLTSLNLSGNPVENYDGIKELNLTQLEIDGDGDFDDFEMISSKVFEVTNTGIQVPYERIDGDIKLTIDSDEERGLFATVESLSKSSHYNETEIRTYSGEIVHYLAYDLSKGPAVIDIKDYYLSGRSSFHLYLLPNSGSYYKSFNDLPIDNGIVIPRESDKTDFYLEMDAIGNLKVVFRKNYSKYENQMMHIMAIRFNDNDGKQEVRSEIYVQSSEIVVSQEKLGFDVHDNEVEFFVYFKGNGYVKELKAFVIDKFVLKDVIDYNLVD